MLGLKYWHIVGDHRAFQKECWTSAGGPWAHFWVWLGMPKSPYGWLRRSLWCELGQHEFCLNSEYHQKRGTAEMVLVSRSRSCWWCDAPGLLSEAELLDDLRDTEGP